MIDQEKAEQKRIYMREYARNRRANDPAFCEKNKEAGRKSQAKRRKLNKDTTKLWKEKNKDKIVAYNKMYGQKNRKELNKKACEINKIRRKNDPNFALMRRERVRVYDVLKGIRKAAKTETLLGCSYDFFRGYIEGKFVENMGWHNMGEWHIDHIQPLCSFDLNDLEQQKKAFHYTNQQPLWAMDNLKKGAKYG
ncbi:hypothetical protein UFOVP267_6 [uncultured Caudovirales phage]|uniref:Uncharacterized protein n=1 Tax=uncultured Caudovirales phage TaxID=2100421 RepID=A0A6J5LHB8_9CAUD|nr:hypothetical protein UFOVP267_6 [uncultured Caudovirales phage]